MSSNAIIDLGGRCGVGKSSSSDDDDVLAKLLARLQRDDDVAHCLATGDSFRLVSYFWSDTDGKQVLQQSHLQQELFGRIQAHKAAHGKSVVKCTEAELAGDKCRTTGDYATAIEYYGRAIKSVPHRTGGGKCSPLAELYSKRALCLYQIGAIDEAEYCFNTCAQLDAASAPRALSQILQSLTGSGGQVSEAVRHSLTKSVTQLERQQKQQSQPNKVKIQLGDVSKVSAASAAAAAALNTQQTILFDPSVLSLWFNNRAKGRKHPQGAHFPCAKRPLEADTKVLEERPLVCVTAQVDATCAACGHVLDRSFWPCDVCDEAIFCDAKCFRSCTHHKFECGLLGYLRESLSPLASVLFHLYVRTHCQPEYSFKQDLSHRPSLPTDSDVHFADGTIPAGLPKRSYQFRYFLLSNGTGNSLTTNPAKQPDKNELLSIESMLALRESADNKDQVLPAIAAAELTRSLLLESIHVWLIIEYITEQHQPIGGSNGRPLPKYNKFRLMGIIDDYRRLYRLNTAQGIVDPTATNKQLYFVQPIAGTFFWPDCQPNVEVQFCSAKNVLIYRTTKPVPKFGKLLVPFPADYKPPPTGDDISPGCRCLSCAETAELKSASVADGPRKRYKLTNFN